MILDLLQLSDLQAGRHINYRRALAGFEFAVLVTDQAQLEGNDSIVEQLRGANRSAWTNEVLSKRLLFLVLPPFLVREVVIHDPKFNLHAIAFRSGVKVYAGQITCCLWTGDGKPAALDHGHAAPLKRKERLGISGMSYLEPELGGWRFGGRPLAVNQLRTADHQAEREQRGQDS